MKISVTKQQEAFVRDLVASGQYGNVSEVMRQALRLLQASESDQEWLEQEIQKGVDGIEAGQHQRVTPKYWADKRARLEKDFRTRQGKRAA